jgi:hypothetical protein
MKRPDHVETPTLASAFEQFLDSASFARRTRESYTDDLAPLLTPYGQAEVSVLTTKIIQGYLAHQETADGTEAAGKTPGTQIQRCAYPGSHGGCAALAQLVLLLRPALGI